MQEINELPQSGNFMFVDDKGSQHRLYFFLKKEGYRFGLYVNGQLKITSAFCWQIPPDYTAAKELVEEFLKKL